MQIKSLTLTILPVQIGICRFDADTPVPEWVYESSFFSVTRTPDELSIVCAEDFIPEDYFCDKGWKVLRVEGPLDLTATGILSSMALPLAHAGVSIFALSTYDTDYLLVRQRDLQGAIETLTEEGHEVNTSD
jgi:hypothetical protein